MEVLDLITYYKTLAWMENHPEVLPYSQLMAEMIESEWEPEFANNVDGILRRFYTKALSMQSK